MGVHDFTIYDFICRNATLYPERDCIVFNDIRLTHKEYKDQCDRMASGLVKAGLSQGDRMGVIAHNSEEFLILYGAAAKIGAIVLPVNWRFQADEVEFVLNDCTPKMVFAGIDFQQMLSEIAPRVKSIEKSYSIGAGTAKEGFTPLTELYCQEGAADEFKVDANQGFVIIHTAAVEGKPRGALLSQANLIYSSIITIRQYNLSKQDCHIGLLPLFHVAGLNFSMAAMHVGGKNAVLERFDPELALKLIEKEKGTFFFNFAPILGMIMEKYEGSSYDISSLKHLTGLDAPENVMKFLKMAPNVTYYTGFGQSEAMGVTNASIDEKPGSAGKPSILSKVTLFDDYDQEVPVGTPGEICVRSPTVFLGYWGLEKDTAYTLRNGWHHTGDIGRFDEDGYLWYVKRKAQKELIKPGGENVYPAEVEKTILLHEAISDVCVIGVPDQKWGEAIKAVCVLTPGKTVEPEVLIEFVASKIARYKKPQQVVFVEALPQNNEGDTDREQIKKDHGAKY